MGLNPKLILAPSLQMYFVDKDNGLPLTNGSVVFFKDQARTIPKPVYQISGTPPNYLYNVLPNPISLSSVGTFMDNSGNDILPYYYPYTGTPDQDQSDVELYYIEVYDSLGVLQFTREGWPNFGAGDIVTSQDITNFVPNGQFLAHINIPAISANNFIADEVYQTVTTLGQGGWTFERSNNSATDLISFLRYPTTEDPTGNPRYAVEINTTAPGTETFKDLRLKFPDVNKFASTTQMYNLYFEGGSLTGSTVNGIQLILIKNFGTGGSTTTETILKTFSLPSGDVISINTPILFGINANKSILADDDFIQLAIRFPGSTSFDVVLTDFALTSNANILTSFPIQTNAEQLSSSTAGWIPTPNPDGSDMYLPIILTPNGFDYDDSEIGTVVSKFSVNPTNNELLCDGSSILYNNYSSIGIPYSRLGQYLIFNSPVAGIPMFGTGDDFANAYLYAGATNIIRITNNTSGLGTACVDGNTGWGIGDTADGASGGRASVVFLPYNYSSNGVQAYSGTTGALTEGSTPTGFTFNFTTGNFNNPYSSLTAEFLWAGSIQTVAASTLPNSGSTAKFFTIGNGAGSYNIWFFFTNETTPGGTNVKITMPSNTLTDGDVSQIVREVIAGYQISSISVSSVPTTGQYFLLTTNPTSPQFYYVWYNVDGAGGDPKITGRIGIMVNTNSLGETINTIASKTMLAINRYQYLVPDLTGLFLRGVDYNNLWDADSAFRWSKVSGLSGTNLGTYQYSQFLSHQHAFSLTITGNGTTNATIGSGGGTAKTPYTGTTNITGGSETRPANAYVNFFIKY